MSIQASVLMCHAPIVIPAIAGSRASQCAETTAAMRRVAAHVVSARPEVLVVISPHTPRRMVEWGVADAASLRGDFGRFGHPEVGLSLPGAPKAASLLRGAAAESGLATWSPAADELDHGALVPLHFVVEAGYAGPTLLVALPYPGTRTETAFGRALAAAAATDGRRWVVLASGDMSHRLQPDAPSGYHPDAHAFDEAFADALRSGQPRHACAVDVTLRELAAEDVVDSTTVALSAVDFDARGLRVEHYEAPFGVGYLEAILYDHTPAGVRVEEMPSPLSAPAPVGPQALLSIAREAIEARLRGAAYTPPALSPPLDASRGVFVTLRDAEGGLRGCIGHMQPSHSRLSAEVADCAVASAFGDPRFAPVTAQELPALRIEISLLGPTEPVRDSAGLDPRRYGVEVRSDGRRGVLLPDIPGVDSVEAQIGIACRKAGIHPEERFEIARFEVDKITE